MIKLKRLQIKRYRNVEPCELVFSDRLNVVIGPNGSGKTALLDLISRVLRTDLSDTHDPFSIDVDLAFSRAMLRGHIESVADLHAGQRKPRPDFRGAPLTAVQGAQVPLFELTLTYPDRSGFCTITRTDDRIPRSRPRDPESIEIEPFFPAGPRWSLVYEVFSRANQAAWGPVARDTLRNVTRFDESLDTFRLITARHDEVNLTDAGLLPQFNAWKITGSPRSHRVAFPTQGMVPRGLAELIARNLGDSMPFVSFDGGDLGFLSTACQLFGMRAATVRIEVTKPGVSLSGFEVTELGNLEFWFTRPDGSVVRDQHLSHGQKRVLSFLYYLAANPDIVIADELGTGLHPAWVQECMNALGGRQAFVASQSPVLLDHLVFTSVADVKETFILCRTEAAGDSEKMIWRNLTDAEAALFYRDYKVGIEHVGELLRTHGLW